MGGYLSKFFYVLSGKRQRLFFLMGLAAFSSILEAFGIGMVGPFVAIATNADKNRPLLEAGRSVLGSIGIAQATHVQILLILGLLLIVIFYVKSYLGFSVQRLLRQFGGMQRRWVAARLMYAYSRAPYTYHLAHNSAELIQTVINETEVFCELVLLPTLFACSNLLIITAIMVLLVMTNAFAVVVVAGVVGVSVGIFQRFKTRIAQWGRDRNESFETSIRLLNDSFGGVKEIRVIGCEPYFEEQVDRELKRYAQSSSAFYAFSNVPRYVMEAFLITFLVLFTCTFLWLGDGDSGQLNSILGIFAMASIRMLPCVGTIVNAGSQIKYATAALDKIYLALKDLESLPTIDRRILSTDPDLWMGKRETIVPMPFESQVTLQNLIYRYPSIQEPALKSISLSFKRGESIALIGRSGAGKTTLVDLLLGLLTPESGDITVDGVSVYHNIAAWQRLVGYVPQMIYLTEDTLARNVAFGVPDHLVDHQQLQHAIELAQLTDLVDRLPQGIDTMVGERGMRLSGGQRQRVGIARALYHDRQILVLDEATAALDNETESLISDAIKALGGQKTLVIIAHRLSTVEHCDRIYLMEDGQIIKTGTYETVVLDREVKDSLLA
jgi:ATP-binding cassette, subfamily B, bacterial PglK